MVQLAKTNQQYPATRPLFALSHGRCTSRGVQGGLAQFAFQSHRNPLEFLSGVACDDWDSNAPERVAPPNHPKDVNNCINLQHFAKMKS